MTAQSETHSEYSAAADGGDDEGGVRAQEGGTDDGLLLAALLDGMDAALCAFDAEGVVTHWNREAEHILGWTQEEAIGRRGLAGWAVRGADAEEVEGRLLGAMHAPGRQVHEFALLTKSGGRVLIRTQCSQVRGADGRPAGVYCAFSEVHTQLDLERSIALSEALFADASWGVILVDADLRPAVANTHAARALGVGRTALLGRPLGELVDQGLEELESALHHVLAEGSTPAPTELWLTLPVREGQGALATDPAAEPGGTGPARRCWRSGFLKLGSPLAQEPVPLGVAWLFQDVTEAKRAEQEGARLRFRDNQLHRAARTAAECEDPMEAAVVHLDFALAGFADHALIDLSMPALEGADDAPIRLVRAAATPTAVSGPCPPITVRPSGGIPVPYRPGHPALQAYERCGSVRASAGGAATPGWAVARKWPEGVVHAMCAVLRSRGRTLGVATFLRGANRRSFDRTDAAYAEDVAVRVAAAIDLAQAPPH